ncbi:MAG: hypothetical protein P4L67_00355 [Candidatus Pacebacteria bacterium]|nr:hypothetical protein [Candidatus Paceibacterota bacterium]
MFNYEEPISIDRAMKEGEPEDPVITLSRLKERLRDINDRIGTDHPTPDDNADIELLTQKIAELEEIVSYKKAA